MSLYLEQIDVRVHPDYFVTRHLVSPDYEPMGLRSKWDERVEEVARNPRAVLLNFSAFPRNPQYIDTTNLSARIKRLCEREIARNEHARQLLGRRFFNFEYPQTLTHERLVGYFEALNINFRYAQALVSPYGEYTRACVPAWGNHIKGLLDIPEANFTILDDLSLSRSDCPKAEEDPSFEKVIESAPLKALRLLG